MVHGPLLYVPPIEVAIEDQRSVYLSVSQSVCLSVCLYACSSIGLPFCMYICLSVCPLSFCLSVCLSVRPLTRRASSPTLLRSSLKLGQSEGV